MLDFLNTNSGAFSVIFAGLVAIATIVYALLTRNLVRETIKMRESQTEPNISVGVQPREEWISFIDFVVQNIGLGPAYDIKFEIQYEGDSEAKKVLSQVYFLKNGVNYLSPSQKIQFFLLSLAENYEENIATSFKIQVFYKNHIGKRYNKEYIIDFSEFEGLYQLGEPPLYKISTNIEKIKTDINKLITGINKLKVITIDYKEYQEQQKIKREKNKKLAEKMKQRYDQQKNKAKGT